MPYICEVLDNIYNMHNVYNMPYICEVLSYGLVLEHDYVYTSMIKYKVKILYSQKSNKIKYNIK